MDTRPIGIFDSGVGGLTVADKVFRLLPNENIIYFGDTARVPYGNKSKEAVTRFSKEIVKFLSGFKVKLIIVACNTASSLSLEALKKEFSIPIIGVIKPGVEEALKTSKTGRIGVIGTERTISSNVYKKEIESTGRNSFIIQESCPLFVPLVENGWLSGDITLEIVRRNLAPLLARDIDTLILGCTHYPLLKKAIQRIAGKNVALIDSSIATAKYTKRLLDNKNLFADALAKAGKRGMGYAKFFVSDDTGNFIRLANIFLRRNIKAKKVVF
ncbi:MAG: glutamate racemase [Candidatus Omnitrophota bacterium]|nr:MAG: glutamate racemase [Candidatus Omnitrophota bacterium]